MICGPKIQLSVSESQLFDFLLQRCSDSGIGTNLWCCGGWVRDRLLGMECDDYDIAIEGMTGQQFCDRIGLNAAIISAKPDQSKHLETATAVVLGHKVEFTNLRDEDYAEAYDDSRILKENRFGTPKSDSERRDFTVNALLYNVRTGDVEDHLEGRGLRDLGFFLNSAENWEKRDYSIMLRTPLDATKTFVDDPLRTLRGMRFLARFENSSFGNGVEKALRDPIVQVAFKEKITNERIQAELIGKREDDGGFKAGLLCHPNSVRALSILYDTGLLDIILDVPQMEGFKPFNMDQNSSHHKYNVFTHTMAVMAELWNHPYFLSLPKLRQGMFAFSALLHDIGKRDPTATQLKLDGHNSYHGHEDSSAAVSRAICNKLKMANDDTDYVVQIVAGHMKPHSEDWGDRRCLRRFIHKYPNSWRDIIVHAYCDAVGSGKPRDEFLKRYDVFIERGEALIIADRNAPNTHKPIISGTVVMKMIPELKPNTGFIREVNAALLEMRLDRPETTEEEYLAKIVEIKPALLEKHSV